MLIHIVKTGETVDKITSSYRILKSDLISNNQHITDFSHLKSGMKLKIPLLSKDTLETLEETEAFIDDYYPSFEKFLSNNEEVAEVVCVKQSDVITTDSIDVSNVSKEEFVVTKEDTKIDEEVITDVKEESNKSSNNNVFQQQPTSCYRGNVIPKYNEKFIKKI